MDYTNNTQTSLEEDWWQDRYINWAKSDYWFNNSEKPLERRIFQAWVKRVGKEAKENNNKNLMMSAYKVLRDYEIYPDPIVNVENEF
jgi:hypothetical protein